PADGIGIGGDRERCSGDSDYPGSGRVALPIAIGDMTIEIKSENQVIGAAPAGATDRDSASRAVREMFTSIAHRYDLLNHVLSFNTDRYWCWRASRTFRHILGRSEARV